jgi:hypothetical protein
MRVITWIPIKPPTNQEEIARCRDGKINKHHPHGMCHANRAISTRAHSHVSQHSHFVFISRAGSSWVVWAMVVMMLLMMWGDNKWKNNWIMSLTQSLRHISDGIFLFWVVFGEALKLRMKINFLRIFFWIFWFYFNVKEI